MNLATRCSTCGTLFRVVQDQLKVSEGWVRCGRCHAVFNAVESLIDLDRGLPAELAAASFQPGPPGDAGAPDGSGQVPLGSDTPEPTTAWSPNDLAANHDGASRGSDAASTARPDTADPSIGAVPVAGFDAPFDLTIPEKAASAGPFVAGAGDPSVSPYGSDADLEAMAVAEPGSLAAGLEPQVEAPVAPLEARPVAPLVIDPLTAEPPLFARAALEPARRARKKRWFAIAIAVLLALLLGGQLLYRYRDLAAARWPALQPVLATACDPLGCSLRPPRRIDEVAVENTALTLTALPGAYRLTVGLRNRADTPIALPSVDLALTDTEGRLLARRVLAVKDFQKTPDAIAAGAEVVLQALLATPGGRVSGYTVEIFYP